MPNQNNFRSDVTNIQDVRFSASRIVRIPEELILFEEVPASFAFDADDNIEIHFYTIPENQLLLSTVIKTAENIIKSHIISYADGTYKNYIRIDFTKLFIDKELVLIPGDYKMTLNLFSDEIGSYDTKKLNIDIISDSRTEVQLSFNDTIDDVYFKQNSYLLKEFLEKAFNKTDAVGFAQKVFISGVELNDPTEGINATNILQNLEVGGIQTTEDTVDRIERINLREIFETQLNDFVQDLFKYIREEIVIKGDDRIQQYEYQKVITDIVEQKIKNLRQTVDSRIVVS
jgi:hypothetical protein